MNKPKPELKKKKTPAPAQTAPEQQATPAWLRAMQDHFQQTGHYRATDLNRLLGDPRDAVSVSADDGLKIFSLSCK